MTQKQKSIWAMIIQDIHDLEYNAQAQYRFHRFWAIFWFATMSLTPVFPQMRINMANLLILEASLWANFATHLAGMSSALAAKPAAVPPEEFQG